MIFNCSFIILPKSWGERYFQVTMHFVPWDLNAGAVAARKLKGSNSSTRTSQKMTAGLHVPADIWVGEGGLFKLQMQWSLSPEIIRIEQPKIFSWFYLIRNLIYICLSCCPISRKKNLIGYKIRWSQAFLWLFSETKFSEYVCGKTNQVGWWAPGFDKKYTVKHNSPPWWNDE